MTAYIKTLALIIWCICCCVNGKDSYPTLDKSKVNDAAYLLKLYAQRRATGGPEYEDIYRALPALLKHYNYLKGQRTSLAQKIAHLRSLYQQRQNGGTTRPGMSMGDLQHQLSAGEAKLTDLSAIHEPEHSIQEKRQEGGDWKRQEGGDWKRAHKRQEGGDWKRQEGGDWKRQEGGDWKRQEGGDWKRTDKRQEGGDWKRQEGGDWKRQEGGDWKRQEGGDWKRQEGGDWKRQEGGDWKRQEAGDWKRQEGGDWKRN